MSTFPASLVLINALAVQTGPCTAKVMFAALDDQEIANPGDVWHDGRIYLGSNFVEVRLSSESLECSGLLNFDGSEGAVANDDGVALCEFLTPEKTIEPITLSGWYQTNKGRFTYYFWMEGRLLAGETLTAAERVAKQEQEQEWLSNPPADM